MAVMDARTEGEGWERLRVAIDELRALAQAPRVSLVALGKAYARLADAMLAAAREAGQSSMRFEAVAKALDLRTSKSSLRSFLQE